MNALRRADGFTLVELLVVITVLSIMGVVIMPRVTGFLGADRGNMIALSSIISKTFDESFLRKKTNFLAIHLHGPSTRTREEKNPLFERENGVSVLTLNDEKAFEDSKSRVLAYKKFPSNFTIDEVILSTGEKITGGTVLIPFYPEGYSEDVIIHLTSGTDRWSVIIYKMRKEPRVTAEYVDFEAVREGNVL